MTYRLLAAAGLAGLVTAQTPAADFTIEVRGVRSGDGRVFVAVHGPESKDTFPSGDGVVAGRRQPAQVGAVRFVVGDLSPGRYAVAAFHDANDNGELDTNLLGIPSELATVREPAPAVAQGTSRSSARLSDIDPLRFMSNTRTRNQSLTGSSM